MLGISIINYLRISEIPIFESYYLISTGYNQAFYLIIKSIKCVIEFWP